MERPVTAMAELDVKSALTKSPHKPSWLEKGKTKNPAPKRITDTKLSKIMIYGLGSLKFMINYALIIRFFASDVYDKYLLT